MPTHGPFSLSPSWSAPFSIGVLTYVPALALGPVVEHLQLLSHAERSLSCHAKVLTLFDSALIGPAVVDAFKKLNPRIQWRSPVMFVVYSGSIITTLLFIQAASAEVRSAPGLYPGHLRYWLWFTVLFANFAEALAEGRSKAQAASLRALKQTVVAKKLTAPKLWRQRTSCHATEPAQGRCGTGGSG